MQSVAALGGWWRRLRTPARCTSDRGPRTSDARFHPPEPVRRRSRDDNEAGTPACADAGDPARARRRSSTCAASHARSRSRATPPASPPRTSAQSRRSALERSPALIAVSLSGVRRAELPSVDRLRLAAPQRCGGRPDCWGAQDPPHRRRVCGAGGRAGGRGSRKAGGALHVARGHPGGLRSRYAGRATEAAMGIKMSAA